MAKPRMTVRPGSRSAASQEEKKRKKKERSASRWRKLLVWGGGLLGVAVLLFCVLVFNIFEGAAQGFTHYVPANVDFFLLKKDLAADLGDGYEPLFLPRLEQTSFWSGLRDSGDLDRLLGTGGEEKIAEFLARLNDLPIDIVHNALGREIAFAGRARPEAQGTGAGPISPLAEFFTQTSFAVYLRVSWKIKLAYSVLRSPLLAGMLVSGYDVRSEGSHVVIAGAVEGHDLLIWRERDMLVLSNDSAYLEEIEALVAEEGRSRKSFFASSLYDRMLAEHEDAEEGDFEAYWILRPQGVLRGMGFEDPIPLPRESDRSTLAGRFLGQIFSTDLVDRIIGYSRARSDPLGIDPNWSGVRLRGQVRLRQERARGARGDGGSIDSPAAIAQDRQRFFTLKLDESLSVPPVSSSGVEKSIELYAGLVPQDVALWAYLAGDLHGFFHIFERSLAPKNKPGEDWDRDAVNSLFVQAIEGGNGFLGYNRRVEHRCSERRKQIPTEAARLASEDAQQLGHQGDGTYLRKRTEYYLKRLEYQLPRPIALDGLDGAHGLRKLLDRLSDLFGKEDGGRGMFILRRNDYGNLREKQAAGEGSIEIPDCYKPDDRSPAWAFVFWVDGRSVREAEETVELFFQELRFSANPEDKARPLDVQISSPEAGQSSLKEYWHARIPGPGEIVTASVQFIDESRINRAIAADPTARRRFRGRLRKKVNLFIISNHILLAQDLGNAAINPDYKRATAKPLRLNHNRAFTTLLRRELSASRRISTFVYFNGVELGKVEADLSLSPRTLEIAVLNELDTPQINRELFRQACSDLGLAGVYREGVDLEILWKRVPNEQQDRMDQRIDELRTARMRALSPQVRARLERQVNYPALTPYGVFSLQAVSANPLKVDFQVFTLVDLSPGA